jgi:hypothetical protein
MTKVVIDFLEGPTARDTDSDCLQTCQRKPMFVVAQTVLNTEDVGLHECTTAHGSSKRSCS